MREIKFRAWNKAAKKMNHFDNPVLMMQVDSGLFFKVKEEYVYMSSYYLMQYTELNDCNGTDIYEGDILKGFDNLFTVKFGNIKFNKVAPNGSINEVETTCFYFEDMKKNQLFPITNNYKNEHDLQNLQVIGNIYENKELLGVEADEK